MIHESVARTRAFDVAVTRCDTARHGLVQPFSAVGAMPTDRSGIANAASYVNGAEDQVPIGRYEELVIFHDNRRPQPVGLLW